MPVKRLSAPGLAGSVSSTLDEARPGSEPSARLPSAAPAAGYPIDRLNTLFAGLPRLGSKNAAEFLSDLRELDRTVGGAGRRSARLA
jgi:hypothetical protein